MRSELIGGEPHQQSLSDDTFRKREREVLDQNVLDLLTQIPREDFVPEAYRNMAFTDMSIPLDHGQSMLPPKVEARMLQALAIKPDDDILHIGTGSGYVTALLASMEEPPEAAMQRVRELRASRADRRLRDAARRAVPGRPVLRRDR